MTDFKTPQDLANELAMATQTLPEQGDSYLDQTVGDGGSVDYHHPISVRAAICQVNPFGNIVRFEGIVEACAQGQGSELLQLLKPSVSEFETVPFREMVPTLEFIESFSDLQMRAEVICRTHFFATCAVSRALIEEVADAGPLGALAQAYLHLPAKPKRRRFTRRSPSIRRSDEEQ